MGHESPVNVLKAERKRSITPPLRAQRAEAIRRGLASRSRSRSHRTPDLASKTIVEYVATLDRHVDPFLGHLQLTEIRPRLLDDWYRNRLEAGAGEEAMSKAVKLLAQILDRALRLELVTSNPARTLPRRRQQRRRQPAVAAPEQIEAIRAELISQGRLGEATLVSVLAYVGPRPMEALALEWADLEASRLSITKALSNGEYKMTKTGAVRWCEVPPLIVQDLREHRVSVGARRGLIWPRATDGAAWRQHNWDNWRRRRFQPIAQRVGLESMVPYDLRHTAASIMIAAGRPVTEVAEQLGHGVEVSASRYQHLLAGARGRPLRSVDDQIRQARRNMKAVPVRRTFGGA